MKIGILGGGGCFALNFANYLHERGIECFGIGRSLKDSAFWQVFPEYQFGLYDVVRDFFIGDERPDIIVNFAAQGEGAASFGTNAPDFYRTNTWALANLVERLRHCNWLKRFIQISSSEVYGSAHNDPLTESAPIRCSSPYAVSKAAFDMHLNIMHNVHGFPMNIVRPSNCYTPGQQLHRIIPKSIITAMKGEKLPLQGSGKARKSYLHATDLSAAILCIIQNGKVGETYNVGPPKPIAIRDLVAHVAEVVGVSFKELVQEVHDRVGQDACYWLNSDKMKRLGWKQTIDIDNGIADVYKWVKKYPELLNMPMEYVHRA